jgi:DNA polymerase I
MESVKSITSYGRHYIGSLIDKASKEGYEVLYSDTDSVFLSLNGKTFEDAKKFVELFNIELPEPMELSLEGFYPRGIFVPVRLGPSGAKKRYALLTEDGLLIVKGFEMVRRNTTKIVKEVQKGVLEIILKEDDTKKALEFVRAEIEKLKSRQVPIRKLVISTELQKPLSEYEAIGPHVAIARRMEEQGYEIGPGSIIRYVICGAGEKIRDKAKLPAECSKEDYDVDYYLNNQVIPAVDRIFEVLGFSKEELLSSLDQSKLNSFFG